MPARANIFRAAGKQGSPRKRGCVDENSSRQQWQVARSESAWEMSFASCARSRHTSPAGVFFAHPTLFRLVWFAKQRSPSADATLTSSRRCAWSRARATATLGRDQRRASATVAFTWTVLHPLPCARDIQLFDTICCRFDGQHFWFECADMRVDPGAAGYMRSSLAELVPPATISRPRANSRAARCLRAELRASNCAA